MLEACFTLSRGAFRLDAALTARPGETLVLVGPSGSGKSTTLEALAGLVHPAAGHIRLDGRTLYDGQRKINVPAHRRPIGYVFQDGALFPHLTVFENVAFGLRASHVRRAQIGPRVWAALERVGATALAQRRPASLSGGEKQRVALARALVLKPRLFLLDEPLSSLDPASRRHLQTVLQELLAETTAVTLLVTHHPLEAVTLADQIAVYERGRIVQQGDRRALLLEPRSAYVAEFIGINLWRGKLVQSAGGLWELRTESGEVRISQGDDTLTGLEEVFASIDPREVTLYTAPPTASAQNVLYGPIQTMTSEGPRQDRIRVEIASRPPVVAEVTVQAAQSLGLRVGEPIYASFKASAVRVYH
ncbi:MAG TPA: ABC transporter ATP-binding protein [Limnochordia bacterium]